MKLNEFTCINENIDLDKYIELREKVKRNMKFPKWLGDLTKSDLEILLNTGSKI